MKGTTRILQAIKTLKEELDAIKTQSIGRDGKDGIDGHTPIKDVDYFDGKDGIDGIGIKNVLIEENGHLIVELTNGKKN